MGRKVGLTATAGRWAAPALALAVGLGGCAYFNALYNAQQQFEEAERYAERGERSRADQAFLRSAQKAAKSFEQDPEGRWADDALYLLARAHFHRGSYPEARAALQRLLPLAGEGDLRAGALAYLGAAELRLGDPAAALPHLQESLDSPDTSDDTEALALLWRARTRAALGEVDAAWHDVRTAGELGGRHRRAARVEAVRLAVIAGDEARVGEAMQSLIDDGLADGAADTLFALTDSATALWGAALGGAVLAPLENAPWPDDRRAALALTRADLAVSAGDTAEAIGHALTASERGTGASATRARLQAARWTLATRTDPDELRQARALLLPALADPSARSLVTVIEVVGVLLETGLENNQPLALFAAAEIARDELAAPGIARSIFLAQASRHPGSPWSMKAVLAAAQLGPTRAERALIDELVREKDGDPYVLAARGDGNDRYGELETQLGRMVTGLRRWGREEAQRRDGVVLQTVLVMDSLRAVAQADSMTVVCGLLLDSLGVEPGLPADSMRAACMRQDLARVDSILAGAIDLRPDSAAADSIGAGFPADTTGGAGEDTAGLATGPGISDGGGGQWADDASAGRAAGASLLRLAGIRPAR